MPIAEALSIFDKYTIDLVSKNQKKNSGKWTKNSEIHMKYEKDEEAKHRPYMMT